MTRSAALCNKHYQRQRKHGTTEVVTFERGTDNVLYPSVHTRLRQLRGNANEQVCVSCGKRARDWAYVGNCPEEKSSKSGKYLLKYCVHITEHYQSMCAKCHVRMDRDL